MRAIPEAFIFQTQAMLGDETPAFLHALEEAPALALRLNPARANAEDAAAPFVEGAVPWEPLGRYLRPDARPGAAIAHAAGAYYVQEASAMASAAALAARPGERVLDLCAAPGGKSTQIAAALAGEGLLVSNDPELSRARILSGNLERLGAANAIVVSALPARLAAAWPETFDAVLVDAPCSGEGMFRRDPATRDEWNPAAPAGCAKRQAEILDAAAEMVRPGGRLVYSTCTFNALENEGSVRCFLARRPDFAPEEFALPGVGASREGMLRLFPHRLRGDGHFVARLRRAGGAAAGFGAVEALSQGAKAARRGTPGTRLPAKPAERARESSRLPAGARIDTVGKALALLRRDVCALPDAIARMRPFTQGERLFVAPESAPPLDGIRVVSPGLCLLRMGRGYVEPEHALAMTLPPEAAARVQPLDDDQAAAYLAGEALPLDGERGWTLMLWRSMPLGWGKRVDGAIKNHLPKGLRRR